MILKLDFRPGGEWVPGPIRQRVRRERAKDDEAVPWTALRDRWEYSHVARAGLAFASFVALVVAISMASGG